MKRFAILLLFVLFSLAVTATPAAAQTVSPLGGVGSLQFFNDDGSVLTTGMVYIFQAQTTTPVAVYIDSSGTTQQPNPVPLGGNGRTQIWLANGTFVKVVLCSSNTDGAVCSAGHILFSADSVPIGSSSSGGGSSPSPEFSSALPPRLLPVEFCVAAQEIHVLRFATQPAVQILP